MGLDLTFLIDRYDPTGDIVGTNRLGTHRDPDFFAIFGRCLPDSGDDCAHPVNLVKPQPLPAGVYLYYYTDTGPRRTLIDQKGDPLTYFTGGDLLGYHHVKINSAPWNQAVWAFLCSLPIHARVVLLWH